MTHEIVANSYSSQYKLNLPHQKMSRDYAFLWYYMYMPVQCVTQLRPTQTESLISTGLVHTGCNPFS